MFKDNKNRWEEYLKWVEWGDKIQSGFDRVAWIRIMGLPIHLWGGGGTTLQQSQKDMGTGINDEIFVAFEGELIKLGIIEFDEDWFPFKFDPSEDYYEKGDDEVGEYDEEDDEDEGISDTWIHDVESEKGEG
ncbi:unnamed protein product [Lactuca virosa]|uniref:DUF4283 domain-containing protein n=1 Tax=Lactuca virosa TaxID=75947 RepID=A0AAU9P5F2_9ASTR|nr:unnamed protein product [Lactuca virosa]